MIRYGNAVADFLTAISKERAISPNFYDGMKTMQVLDAALTSAKTGVPPQ